MDIDRELFDEENSYMQIQDRWENFGTQNGIADDGYDHHSLHGAPRFEVTEKINALLNGILTTDENLILRRISASAASREPSRNLPRSTIPLKRPCKPT